MKKIDGLFDILTDMRMLELGYMQTQEGRRKTRPTAIAFKLLRFHRLSMLRDELIAGTYRPGHYLIFKVHEPKERDVAAPVTRDKVVQYGAHILLDASYHDIFLPVSFACRSCRHKAFYERVFNELGVHRLHNRPYGEYGQHAAAKYLQKLIHDVPRGWVARLDCKKFFYSIDRELLKGLLRKRIADDRFLALLDVIIDSSPTGERGIPLGSATSQNLANILMNELDQYSVRFLCARGYMRYQDDVFAVFESKSGAREYLNLAKKFLVERLHLTPNEKKTKISATKDGVSALGYKIWPNYSLIREQLTARLKRKKKFMMNRLASLHGRERLRYRNDRLRPVFGSYLGVLRWCNGYHLAMKLFGGLNYVKIEDRRYYYGRKLRPQTREGSL